MDIKDSIFRQYDIRGVVGKDFPEEFAFLLGKSYARLAKEIQGKEKLKIVVGRDCRKTSETISGFLLAGIESAGCEVVNLGMVTTPITYFSIHHLNLDGGIMVTGSHNPPEYNGFKICVGKGTLYGDQIQTLKKYVREIEGDTGSISSLVPEEYDIITPYTDFYKEHFKAGFNTKLVVDAGNGSAGPTTPKILRELGCEVTELFCEPDGMFPNHEADPTVEENLVDVQKELASGDYDLGVAFDGDGDRIGIVAKSGRIIWGDELMVILSRSVLKANPGATIISEVKSSSRLYNDIEAHGGNAIMWKTGHSLIKAKIKETGALLAGEMSGHIFFSDRFFGFDDALYATCRLLEVLKETGQTVEEIISDLPPAFNTPEIRVDCDDDLKWKVVETLKSQMQGEFKVNDIDGVRIDFKDGWALARASNTQPVIVTRFEAQSKARLEELRSLFETKIEAILRSFT